MSKTQKVTVKDPQNKEIWAPCATCGKTTAHTALTQVTLYDSTHNNDIQWGSEEYTVQCGGCKTIKFCSESTCSEDCGYDDHGQMEYVVRQRVFPSCISGRPLLEERHSLPHGIANIYQQTHEAISNNQSILAGIGLRAIVEAVCEEKNASGANLFQRIDDLVTKGVITRSGSEILHSIRLMGNASAHEVQANSEGELTTALEVVEHVLQGVYLIPHKARRLNRT